MRTSHAIALSVQGGGPSPAMTRIQGRLPGNRRERTVVTGSNDVDEIYHRMAVIRREPHTNVRESVAGAEAVVDWGRYTWTYPWIALGAAAAVGYLIYTSGHQKVTADTASLADGPRLVNRSREPGPRVRNDRGSAGISCSPPGTSCSPWPSVRARITCCIGSNNNTRRGLWTGPLLGVGRGAERPDGPGEAVGIESQQRLRSKPGFWRSGQ